MKRKLLTIMFIALFSVVLSTAVSAASSYTIKINCTTNVVTVYNSKDKPIEAFACSTGLATPTGTFYTQEKYRWKLLMGPSYGQYSTRIVSDVLFHSVPSGSPEPDTVPASAYNKLGTTASHGCVRLTVADAKWIYDNCPIGTKVIIFVGSKSDDPLGKPETIKLKYSGWDPTDPDPKNPYRSKQPKIVINKPTEIQAGTAFNRKTDVSAYDIAGNDITSKLKVKGVVRTKKLGTYSVRYRIKDVLGYTAEQTVEYKVVDKLPATITNFKSWIYAEWKTETPLHSKAVNATGSKLKVKVKLTAPSGMVMYCFDGGFVPKQVGKYKAEYYVTNPNNGKVTTKYQTIRVKDTAAPVFSNIPKTKTLETKKVYNLRYWGKDPNITAKLETGRNVWKHVKVSVKAPSSNEWVFLKNTGSKNNYKEFKFTEDGEWLIRYIVTNPNPSHSQKTTQEIITATVLTPEKTTKAETKKEE